MKMLLLILLLFTCSTVHGYDQKTTDYLAQLNYDLEYLNDTTSATDRRGQQVITALQGQLEGITIDMARCPFQKLQGRDKGLCKTWRLIKMKPQYKGIIYK